MTPPGVLLGILGKVCLLVTIIIGFSFMFITLALYDEFKRLGLEGV